MWILEPRSIGPSNVTASNIIEDDAPDWVSGNYHEGDRVIHEHYVWLALAHSVHVEPSLNASDEWFREGPTNKFRPFDQTNINQAEAADEITYTIVPGTRIDTLSFLDLNAASVSLVIKSGGVTVYDQTLSTLSSANRGTFYTWGFAPREFRPKISFFDLPMIAGYATAEFEITISQPGGVAKVGEILLGQVWRLGKTLFETEPRLLNFAVDERDDFGNSILVRRRSTRSVTYRVAVSTDKIEYALDRFERLTGTKLLFLGGATESKYGTTVFATIKDLSMPISNQNITQVSIAVEGFIA